MAAGKEIWSVIESYLFIKIRHSFFCINRRFCWNPIMFLGAIQGNISGCFFWTVSYGDFLRFDFFIHWFIHYLCTWNVLTHVWLTLADCVIFVYLWPVGALLLTFDEQQLSYRIIVNCNCQRYTCHLNLGFWHC